MPLFEDLDGYLIRKDLARGEREMALVFLRAAKQKQNQNTKRSTASISEKGIVPPVRRVVVSRAHHHIKNRKVVKTIELKFGSPWVATMWVYLHMFFQPHISHHKDFKPKKTIITPVFKGIGLMQECTNHCCVKVMFGSGWSVLSRYVNMGFTSIMVAWALFWS